MAAEDGVCCPAYVKRVRVNIKKIWRLHETSRAIGVVVLPSYNCIVELRPDGAPYSVDLAVSHGLKPDDFDRFTIQFQEEPWPSSHTIYLADVQLLVNGDDARYPLGDFAFLIAQQGATFAGGRSDVSGDPPVLEALVANKTMILKAARFEAKRSRPFDRLIESAKASPIQAGLR